MADSQGLIIADDWMSVKFLSSVKTTGLTNEHFRLFINDGTPTELSDPFQPIVVANDFESISRTLTLYFKTALTANTAYILLTTGLVDAANRTLEDVNYFFTTGPTPTGAPTVPVPEPTFVIDQSLVPDITSELIEASNPEFYIVSIDPSEPFVDNDYNNGRVVIKFSRSPSGGYLSTQYFRAQRKLISRQMSRWTDVDVHVSMDGERPWVYVDFPSLDATPVYVAAAHNYFETTYKYRIKISKDISI